VKGPARSSGSPPRTGFGVEFTHVEGDGASIKRYVESAVPTATRPGHGVLIARIDRCPDRGSGHPRKKDRGSQELMNIRNAPRADIELPPTLERLAGPRLDYWWSWSPRATALLEIDPSLAALPQPRPS